MKIDLSTPYKDVLTTLQREHDKAIYWYNKEIKRLHGTEVKMWQEYSERVKNDPEHMPTCGPVITWTSPDGNQWILVCVFYWMKNANRAGWKDYQYCYYETEGSVGYFAYTEDDCIFACTSHFFQRYEERMEDVKIGDEGHSLVLLCEYLCRNPCEMIWDDESPAVTYEKDGLTHFYGANYDGLMMGIIRDDGKYLEVRSFVPTAMMFKEQREKAKPLFDMVEEYRKNNEDKAVEDSKNSMSDFLQEYWKFKAEMCLSLTSAQDAYGKKIIDYSFSHCRSLRHRDRMFGNYLNLCYVLDTNKICSAPVEKLGEMLLEVGKEQEQMGTNIKGMADVLFAVVLKLKKMLGLDTEDEELQKRMDELSGRSISFTDRHPDIYKQNKNEESMNSTIVTAFKQCMKKNGAKNFDTLVKEFCKGDVNSYLSLAEVEYVVSRIAAVAQSDRDREKYREANKAWLSLVIDNDWSQLLRPYTGRYGKELVKMSICDMIDHDEWWSPALNTDLKNHGDEFLRMQQKGLEAIDDDINEKIFNDESLEALLPGHKVNENENENKSKVMEGNNGHSDNSDNSMLDIPAEEATMPELIDFADTPKRSGLLCSPDVARRSLDNMHKCIDMFSRMYQNVSAFVDENGKDDVAQKTCERQQREIDRLQKKIDELKEKNDKLETQRGEAQALANSRHEEITKLKKDKEQLEKDKESIIKRYNDLDKQHTELKEKAQDGTPRKKMITLSRLTKFANMGSFDKPSKSCMQLIEQVFPLVDVVVDMKH